MSGRWREWSWWARLGRRICLRTLITLLVLVAGVSVFERVRSCLLARRIEHVISGLSHLRLGSTTEAQLVQMVPDLVRDSRHNYRVCLSNQHDWRWASLVPAFVFSFWDGYWRPGLIPDKWSALSGVGKVEYALGRRNLSFTAGVTVANGVVTGIGYELEPDVFLGWPVSDLVVAHNADGFWARGRPIPVSDAADQNPSFRFGAVAGQFSMIAGADNSIAVAFTPDAPRSLVGHAFQVDLSCFWSIRGCDSVRQVVPRLWEDRRTVQAAATARLASPNPCPDTVLAGRVRTLPDLNVTLWEVSGSGISRELRMREVILGRADGSAHVVWQQLPDDAASGQRFLYFSGARFASCLAVPDTPSAESAIRTAVPSPRQEQDDISWMYGRM